MFRKQIPRLFRATMSLPSFSKRSTSFCKTTLRRVSAITPQVLPPASQLASFASSCTAAATGLSSARPTSALISCARGPCHMHSTLAPRRPMTLRKTMLRWAGAGGERCLVPRPPSRGCCAARRPKCGPPLCSRGSDVRWGRCPAME